MSEFVTSETTETVSPHADVPSSEILPSSSPIAAVATPQELETVEILKKQLFEYSETNNIKIEFTDMTILRFLRGKKHVAESALDGLIKHHQWRKENVDCLNMEHVATEKSYGKGYIQGKDLKGRPCIHVFAGKHNKWDRNIDSMKSYLIYLIEEAIRLSIPDDERLTLVFSLKGFTLRCMDYEFVKLLIDVLQTQYPDTLGDAIIVDSPYIFSGCWMLIRPWLDPVTSSKVTFSSHANLVNLLDESSSKADTGDIPPVPEGEESNETLETPVSE